jgi:3-dehydrosphinganine reductase
MKDFNGKTVYITGGSMGIGKAVARLMVARGANVLIFARRQQFLDEAVLEMKATTTIPGQKIMSMTVDLTVREEVEKVLANAVAEFGAPDVLINCAGKSQPAYCEDVTFEHFDYVQKLNLYGTWNMISILLPLLKERGGYIVNTSSIAGFIGVFGFSSYSAAKFALIGLSEVLRSELKSSGITVSVLCPPDTDTPGLVEENLTKPPETVAISSSASLMKPEDVAAALLKGMAKKQFMIIPNVDGKFTHIMKRLFPGLVDWVIDMQVRNVQKTKVKNA